MTNAVQLI